MGAGQSVSDQGGAPTKGLHILRVTRGSPASQTNLEPFFDFVVGYEDPLKARKYAGIETHDFERVVEEHEGRPLILVVWNNKTRSLRHVPITPSRAWSQSNTSEDESTSQPSLLGLSMRVCEPEFSLDNVWHVLDVLEGSPAESAGLVPYGDWIVGWSGGVLSAESDFYDLVEAHEDKPLRVYVYSYDFDTLREVVLVPNRQWGGEGLLGCVFGFGLLHRIPVIQDEETDDALPPQPDVDLYVPADDTAQLGNGPSTSMGNPSETQNRQILNPRSTLTPSTDNSHPGGIPSKASIYPEGRPPNVYSSSHTGQYLDPPL